MQTPLYVKHNDMVNTKVKEDFTITICDCINEILGDGNAAQGAIKDRAVWIILVNNNTNRGAILQRGLVINKNMITVYDRNPFEKKYDTNYSPMVKSEIVTFKGLLPFEDVENELIKTYLKEQKDIIMKSDIIMSKSRRADKRLTNYLNGNRHVYLEEGFKPLPKQVTLGNKKIYISHASQLKKCMRCKNDGHNTSDITKCDAYIENEDIILFNSGIMSNMHDCKLRIDNRVFATSEHAYQYAKAVKLDRLDIADQILKTKNPYEAKKLTKEINYEEIKNKWDNDKIHYMTGILIEKYKQNETFRNAIHETEDKKLFEATKDREWGCGLPLSLAKNTKSSYFPGKNLLGEAMTIVRDMVNKDITNIDILSIDNDEEEENCEEIHEETDEKEVENGKTKPKKGNTDKGNGTDKKRLRSSTSSEDGKGRQTTKQNKIDINVTKNIEKDLDNGSVQSDSSVHEQILVRSTYM